ncbi:protein of unknown function [Moritella yayanosii]|uniref:Uncharacterized protein n=1 Tax=Moritella yayanosii TaxID=69539 RepID=A0A330LXF3_9GAMM|nr:protein of unknown function [Moritella yayanosii]
MKANDNSLAFLRSHIYLQNPDYLAYNSCELLTAKAAELPVDNRLHSFLTFL